MNEQEIFEKLKEALDYEYLCTDFGGKDVTNLEEYLYAIKMERSLEKEFDQIAIDTHKTYVEFINYLAEKAIGYKDYIIETFNNNEYNKFIGYLKTKKIIIDDKP